MQSGWKRIVTGSADKTARLWDTFPNTQALASRAKADIPRCLTLDQRKAFFLPPEPPAWCIEMEKWPHNTPEWKEWLADKRAGRSLCPSQKDRPEPCRPPEGCGSFQHPHPAVRNRGSPNFLQLVDSETHT